MGVVATTYVLIAKVHEIHPCIHQRIEISYKLKIEKFKNWYVKVTGISKNSHLGKVIGQYFENSNQNLLKMETFEFKTFEIELETFKNKTFKMKTFKIETFENKALKIKIFKIKTF